MSTHTSYADVLAGFGLKADEVPDRPPRNDDGQPICARERLDGSPCTQEVGLPGVACSHHESTDPIMW
ncbi:MAG: hypothetical protein M8354_03520 [Halalkalicoccus sp.]|nr:hypothetical protein [Halalkalicoccus sp.]